MTGYNKNLYILPFDHRGSLEKMFVQEGQKLTDKDKQKVKDAKWVVYNAFEAALEKGVPQDNAAILVDEEYGSEILLDAAHLGFTTILTTEKSGQDVFDFEYGENFSAHIEKFKPTFVKALVRYNPDGDTVQNGIQLERLRRLSEYCQGNSYKFLIEPIIPATDQQMADVANDKIEFDVSVRPLLEVKMIQQFQDAGVEPDVWKIEGMENSEDYQKVVMQARSNGRQDVGVVILGRGAGRDTVVSWIKAGREVAGIIGFAVGRTVFWDPLLQLRDGKITRTQAVDLIVDNYVYFYELFTGKK